MNQQLRLEILERHQQRQSSRAIAKQLRVSRKTIRKLLAEHERTRREGAPHPDLPTPPQRRGSQLDSFQPVIEDLLTRYPKITAIRVEEELRKVGYRGGYTILRTRIQELRGRKPPPPVVRFETAPGQQAQMDWSVYELDFTAEGRRRVNLFSYILGYSRRQYIGFSEQQDFDSTIRQHVRAFTHLGGVAATCLYDNMKVVVQRWEDEQPLYNTRFLAFAAHYGYRPMACRPYRPETKGKVERPFHYVETNLLNGRTFRSLEHLQETASWWLANVADVRVHRETKKRPVDAHAEELPHLIPLPNHHYDTSQVVYRVACLEGFVTYRQNGYSIPWRSLGQLLAVRVTEQELIVYDRQVQELARHPLYPASVSGQRRVDPSHRPPRDQQVQLEWLQEQYRRLGDVGTTFLEGLLRKQRCGKHQAQRVLLLLQTYERADLLRALERAVRYQAYSLASLERILAAMAQPRPTWQILSPDQQQLLRDLGDLPDAAPRPTSDYQFLLFDDSESTANPNPEKPPNDAETTDDAEKLPPESDPP